MGKRVRAAEVQPWTIGVYTKTSPIRVFVPSLSSNYLSYNKMYLLISHQPLNNHAPSTTMATTKKRSSVRAVAPRNAGAGVTYDWASHQQSIPRLPLPKLEETLQRSAPYPCYVCRHGQPVCRQPACVPCATGVVGWSASTFGAHRCGSHVRVSRGVVAHSRPSVWCPSRYQPSPALALHRLRRLASARTPGASERLTPPQRTCAHARHTRNARRQVRCQHDAAVHVQGRGRVR